MGSGEGSYFEHQPTQSGHCQSGYEHWYLFVALSSKFSEFFYRFWR
jgi:hypothetical protein